MCLLLGDVGTPEGLLVMLEYDRFTEVEAGGTGREIWGRLAGQDPSFTGAVDRGVKFNGVARAPGWISITRALGDRPLPRPIGTDGLLTLLV